MRHVQKEGLVLLNRLGDGILGLQSDRFGKKGVGLMIFFQSGDCSSFSFRIEVAIAVFSQIATGGTKGTACDINIESKLCRVFAFMSNGGKVCFASKDCMIAIGSKNGG